ncbi:MAG: hypothetical protein ACLQO1_25220 [Steroidobacteraceae bacterium]
MVPGGQRRAQRQREVVVAQVHAVDEEARMDVAESALACAGLEDRYHWALRYSFALDDSVRENLRAALLAVAERHSRAERWAPMMATTDGPRPYLSTLANMALLEERAPARFLKPSKVAIGRPRCMHAVLLNISTDLWRRCIEPKYEVVVNEYRIWLGIGTAHMRRALREEG